MALLGQLIDHAYQAANHHGVICPRHCCCRGELANVAPLPNLAELAST